LQQNSALTPDQVKARLMKTATKNFPSVSYATDPVSGVTYASAYDFLTVGAGYLDILAALNNSDLAAKQALSPGTVYNASTRTVSMVSNSSVIWGSSVAWGCSVVWGSSVIWGSSVVWADATPNGQSVIWGSSVVWADAFTSGGERTSILGEK
jgi:serine protease AprX